MAQARPGTLPKSLAVAYGALAGLGRWLGTGPRRGKRLLQICNASTYSGLPAHRPEPTAFSNNPSDLSFHGKILVQRPRDPHSQSRAPHLSISERGYFSSSPITMRLTAPALNSRPIPPPRPTREPNGPVHRIVVRTASWEVDSRSAIDAVSMLDRIGPRRHCEE